MYKQDEENFSRKSISKIGNKTRFLEELSHQGESSSSKGRYNSNFDSRVKRNNEVDTP